MKNKLFDTTIIHPKKYEPCFFLIRSMDYVILLSKKEKKRKVLSS